MNEVKANGISVSYDLPIIKCDLEELKQEVKEIVNTYKDLVVTEDDVKSGKETVAKLNKTAKAISDRRIEIVRKIKAPLDEFETEIKGLTKEIENVASAIKSQLDVYEEQRKESKKQTILSSPLWETYMEFNLTWLNASSTMKAIEEDMLVQKQNFENRKLMIESSTKLVGLNPDKYIDLLWQNKDVNEIIQLIQNDSDLKREVLSEKSGSTTPQVKIELNAESEVYRLNRVIVGTKAQLKALNEYALSIGVKIEKE